MGHYCGGGQGHKAREMNADGGRGAVSLCPGSPCLGLSSQNRVCWAFCLQAAEGKAILGHGLNRYIESLHKK